MLFLARPSGVALCLLVDHRYSSGREPDHLVPIEHCDRGDRRTHLENPEGIPCVNIHENTRPVHRDCLLRLRGFLN